LSDSWIRAEWVAPPGVIAGTTTRLGGVSNDHYESLNLGQHVGDEAVSIIENRRRFVTNCGLPEEPVWLNQTHSINVAVDRPENPDDEVDALVTCLADHPAVVMTADCLPVVFAASDGSEVGIAHAGWRGLCNGILQATVSNMRARPGDVSAWLGPAISQKAFEVGPEVREQFAAVSPGATAYFAANDRGRFQADLHGLARLLLKGAGVEDVSGGNHCTFTEKERFFSYRRDGQCGRMATFVYRAESA
jgi:YfiH family protein